MWTNIKEIEKVLKDKKYIPEETQIHWSEAADLFFIVKKLKTKSKKYIEQVEDIKQDLNTMSIRQVANKYNMSTRTVQQIKKGIY